MSNELTGNRYDNLVRRVGNMQGPGSKLMELVPSGMPVFPLENEPLELLFLAGKRSFVRSHARVPGAGLASRFALQNPAGSNVIATITRMWLGNFSAATEDNAFWTTAAGTAIATVGFRGRRDSRLGGEDPVVDLSAIDIGGAILPFILPRLEMTRIDDVATIAPGSELQVTFGTVNVLSSVVFHWYERLAEPSELNF